MEKTLFISRFASGNNIFNSKYSFFNPIRYRGMLTVKFTKKRILITCLGMTVWESLFSQIYCIKIKPEALGASIAVTLHDKEGFEFIINNLDNLIEELKKLNLPLQYEVKSLEGEVKRFKIISHPIVLFIASIISLVFITFIIYNIFYLVK